MKVDRGKNYIWRKKSYVYNYIRFRISKSKKTSGATRRTNRPIMCRHKTDITPVPRPFSERGGSRIPIDILEN
uniref:Uncharacterized protein n=1 Tax=Romanomermis culicivorax TaxID=13658 RepID=A0A915JYN1_ROMCU